MMEVTGHFNRVSPFVDLKELPNRYFYGVQFEVVIPYPLPDAKELHFIAQQVVIHCMTGILYDFFQTYESAYSHVFIFSNH